MSTLFRLALVGLLAGSQIAFGAESEEDLLAEAGAPVAAPDEAVLSMCRDGQHVLIARAWNNLLPLASVYKAGKAARVEALVRALVAGPTKEERLRGVTSVLPAGSALGKIQIPSETHLEIYLDLPPAFVKSRQYRPRFVEDLGHHFIDTIREEGVRHFQFFVKDPDTGTYRPIRDFLSKEPLQGPEPDNALTDGTPAAAPAAKADAEKGASPTGNPGPVTGALSGKAVVLNQSHGWFDDDNFGRWRVQRSRTYQGVEDFHSAEFLNHYVVPMLLNAGARVQPVRETDPQPNRVIIDNSSGAPGYVETGSWSTSSSSGFTPKSQWTGTLDNPWGNASATRFSNIAPLGSPTATATYTPTIPAAGFYNVYISFSSGSNRSSGAHWQVHHSGGTADFRINERIDGATWYLLGNFHFEAGTTGKVVLLNDAADGSVVTCDAVRFGGGNGVMARRSHGLSNRPMWQEEAVNYLQFTGMLASSLMSGDDTVNNEDEELGWGNRPQYAQWERNRDSEGNNVIYLGWHTNASSFSCDTSGNEVSGTGRGTSAYRDVDADATAGTENLTSLVHNSVIDQIRKFYQAGWNDRGIVASNSYGECSQGNLGGSTGVSGFFFEGLFHDNSADSAAYRDPKFRAIVARALVQGIISYWGGTVFPPETPTHLRVKSTGGGQVRLDWAQGPVRTATLPYGSAPTQYRVYRSTNGYGFDSGTDTGNLNTFFTTTVTPGQVTYFRVAAVNSAGVSFPTETLAVRAPAAGATSILVVNGSDRNDRFIPAIVTISNIGGCSNSEPNTVRRIQPRTFQSFDYVVQHGKAIAGAGAYFDSSSNEAVDSGAVSLTSYAICDWIGGQEAETDTADGEDNTALKSAERTVLQTFLQGGGKLFMSNSELAWDFDRSGADASKSSFLRNYMKAAYSSDDANTYNAQGAGGIFSGIGSFAFDNVNGATYDVRFPDVLTPNGGAVACLSYVGGTGGTAAVQYAGTFGASGTPGKLVYMGFGFETISSEATRNAIMANVLSFFGSSEVADWSMF